MSTAVSTYVEICENAEAALTANSVALGAINVKLMYDMSGDKIADLIANAKQVQTICHGQLQGYKDMLRGIDRD